jgi:eukaryotic-like serine/threonine-protein kinase
VLRPDSDSFGNYEVIRVLGEGGMGAVLLAEQTHPLKRRVALKVIRPGMDSEQVLQRFNYERQSLAIMEHPGIARVFDAGLTGKGRPFFAMEYVDGVPITQYCDSYRLSVEARLRLFLLVCEAVQHAHRKGVIHRDIKPSNILVAEISGKAVPKVIDFGIAKAIHSNLADAPLTQIGQLVGTPDYMSPEQAELVSGFADTSTDVYSLGVLLYELLVGTVPIESTTLREAGLTEFLRVLREREAPTLESRLLAMGEEANAVAERRSCGLAGLRKQLRGDLTWIVAKAVEKLSQNRYPSVLEFANDVQRLLDHQPVQATPPSGLYQTRKFIRRHRVALSAAAAVFVALLAGLTVAAWEATVANRERAEALSQRERAEEKSREATRQQQRASAAERLALAGQEAAETQSRIALAEKQRADAEAASARAVTEFLQNDLLSQAYVGSQMTPNTSADRDLKVRTALERAADRIGGKFAKQPLVEASIRQTIGMTYYRMNLPAEARPQIDLAVQLYTRAAGPEAPATLSARADQGLVVQHQGRYAEAEQILVPTLAAARRALGPSHRTTLAAMQGVGMVYERVGKSAQAEALRRELWQTQRRLLGEEHPETLSAMGQVAGSCLTRGAFEEAEELFAKIYALRKRSIGAEHPETLQTLYGWTTSLSRLGEHEKAVELNRSGLEISRRVLGTDQNLTHVFLNSLANSYIGLGKAAEAEGLYREAVSLRSRQLGATHPYTLMNMGNLATSLALQGKYEDAVGLQRQVLEQRRKQLGAENPASLTTLQSLAAALAGQGDLTAAAELYSEHLVLQRKTQGPEHPATIQAMSALGEVYRRNGQAERAEPLLKQVLELRRRKSDTPEEQLVKSMLDLALLYLGQGRKPEAARLAQDALGEYDAGADSALTRSWRYYLAQSILGASQPGSEALLANGYQGLQEREKTIPLQDRHYVVAVSSWR